MSKVPMVGSRSAQQATWFLASQPYTLDQKDFRFKEAFDIMKEHKDSDNLEELLLEVMKKDIGHQASKLSDGKIEFKNGVVYYEGEELHNIVCDKIYELFNDGLPVDGLIKFVEKLMQNPRRHVLAELYKYLEKNGLPITESGEFLSYKKVARDYSSWHKDKNGKSVYNTPGTTVEMRRNEVDDTDERDCSYGLHAGAMDYVKSFSVNGCDDKILVVAIDPSDVVTVPYHDCRKLRTCKYRVLYEIDGPTELTGKVFTDDGSELPSNATYILDDDWEDFEEEFSDEYEDDYEDYNSYGEYEFEEEYKPSPNCGFTKPTGFKKPEKDSNGRYI